MIAQEPKPSTAHELTTSCQKLTILLVEWLAVGQFFLADIIDRFEVRTEWTAYLPRLRAPLLYHIQNGLAWNVEGPSSLSI